MRLSSAGSRSTAGTVLAEMVWCASKSAVKLVRSMAGVRSRVARLWPSRPPPRNSVALAWLSASITRTRFWWKWARSAARFTVVTVLATPPLRFMMAMVFNSFFLLVVVSDQNGRSSSSSPAFIS